MSRKSKLILKIILIVATILFFGSDVYATANTKEIVKVADIDSFDEIKSKADGFLEQGKDKGSTYISSQSLQNMVIPIARILVAVATVVVSVVTLIMGIKYLMASPDEKGKLKQQLVGLVVSVVVIYGAQGIWALVYNFMSSVTK